MRCKTNVSGPGQYKTTAYFCFGSVNPPFKIVPCTIYTPGLPSDLLLEPSTDLSFRGAV